MTIETERDTIDVEAYNASLLREPERARLRAERTTTFLRRRVAAAQNGHRHAVDDAGFYTGLELPR